MGLSIKYLMQRINEANKVGAMTAALPAGYKLRFIDPDYIAQGVRQEFKVQEGERQFGLHRSVWVEWVDGQPKMLELNDPIYSDPKWMDIQVKILSRGSESKRKQIQSIFDAINNS